MVRYSRRKQAEFLCSFWKLTHWQQQQQKLVFTYFREIRNYAYCCLIELLNSSRVIHMRCSTSQHSNTLLRGFKSLKGLASHGKPRMVVTQNMSCQCKFLWGLLWCQGTVISAPGLTGDLLQLIPLWFILYVGQKLFFQSYQWKIKISWSGKKLLPVHLPRPHCSCLPCAVMRVLGQGQAGGYSEK